MFPPERGCLAIMFPLATHPTNKNEMLAWDLAHDPSELALLKPDAVACACSPNPAICLKACTACPSSPCI